jgi:hypothetical protein
MKERVFKNKKLSDGWKNIGTDVPWWFDIGEEDKADTLGKTGVPILWGDEAYTIEEIKECTGEEVCSIFLTKDDKKVMVLVNKDLPQILIYETTTKAVTWKDYTKEGLWAIKKQFPDYGLEAVVINPKLKTLEKFGVLSQIINETINDMDFLNGEGNGSAEGED